MVGHHGAEADRELVVVAELRALGAQGVLQPLFDRLAVQQLVAVPAQQGHRRELVAAEPRHHVALPEGGAQHVGDGHEQLVAFRVAFLVVGALQAVHVEVHEQHLPVAAPRAAPDLVDLGEEAAPVEQAGELVDVRQAAQELLELLVRGDAVTDQQAEPATADVDEPRA